MTIHQTQHNTLFESFVTEWVLIYFKLLCLMTTSHRFYFQGMKLESEIQNSIMTRYFYYQLINVYVTVGFSGSNLWLQIINTLEKPQVSAGCILVVVILSSFFC